MRLRPPGPPRPPFGNPLALLFQRRSLHGRDSGIGKAADEILRYADTVGLSKNSAWPIVALTVSRENGLAMR